MIERISPEEAGISTAILQKYIENLNKRGLRMHGVMMMRHGKVFYEGYWAPFNKDFKHRMYSVTKSFVSVAVGLAEEDGLINLDAKIATYFPEKIEYPLCENLKEQTVREMLTMTTTGLNCGWFGEKDMDRTHLYFSQRGERRVSGTIWEYDSSGSQVLSSLVEKVTGKRLFDYLNERIFTHLGTFKNAEILKVRNGDSWGDSAMICTLEDLISFANFVMHYGIHNGKRLMNGEYLKTATSKVVDNRYTAHGGVFYHGYGYQIWKTEEDGFAFVGMGDQLAVCLPKYDLIFVCCGDDQGNESARDYIVNYFFDYIVANIEDKSLEINEEATKKLKALTESLKLFAVQGEKDSPYREKINNVKYVCKQPNPLGLYDFMFHFDNEREGTFIYTTETGNMELPFYVNENRFGKFPELGYSNEYGGLRTTNGFKYDDAVSMAWTQDNKIMIFAQIIDKYFGNTAITVGFKGDKATVNMEKSAEDFLWKYQGQAWACKKC